MTVPDGIATALICWILAILIACAMLMMSLVSLREKEKLAAGRALGLAVILPLPFVLSVICGHAACLALRWVLIALIGVGILVYLLPISGKRYRPLISTSRQDERDIMFSRAVLEPGSDRFEAHYRNRPEQRLPDERFRAKPGLASPDSLHHHELGYAAAQAAFATVAALHPLVESPASIKGAGPSRIAPDEATDFIKAWALKLGAVSVGVTELKDHHLYTHVGRGDDWGQEVDLTHKYAIALAVEMDKEMIDCAPLSATLMESARKYMDSGSIAVQLAVMIRDLGHEARAHIDANYRVICPLVAKDAGLGEIGRMGLLMTPELGPRVRLAVVTTDLPLLIDTPTHDDATLDFCSICRKCTDCCPARAITREDRDAVDGSIRWKIDSEACFTHWCTIGTDCGRCIQVCPYAHPDNLLHDIIRRGVNRSAPFRHVALKLDDVFYGRRPATAPLPEWMGVGASNRDLSDT